MNPSQSTPGQGQAGLYRLAASDLPALREATDMLGQAFYLVDLSRARNVPGFIKAMQRDLGFPEPFGRNLDALHDCLTDLHEPRELIVRGTSALDELLGRRANAFRRVLDDSAEANPNLTVQFEDAVEDDTY